MIRLAALFLFFAMTAPSVADDGLRPFVSGSEAMSEAEAALDRAAENGKRVILVFGANWCHDSRGLADHFAQADMEALIAAHYELVWIDIGWRERNLDVMRRFGAATVYGTPTVLVHDPELGLLNRDTMHSWHTAYSRSHDAVVDYFTAWATARPASSLTATTEIYQTLVDDIAAWEAREAERLNDAYAQHAAWREELAPYLDGARRDAGASEEIRRFHAVEAAIDRHRATMRADRDALYAEAHDRVREALLVEAGSEPVGFATVDRLNANPPAIELDYPAYTEPLYPWEN